MKLGKLLLTLLLFVPLFGFSQAIIKGSIVDSTSNETLPGATVSLFQEKLVKGTATDSEGNYTIKGLKAGEYTLEVNYLGYRKLQKIVTLKNGENLINLGLSPSAYAIKTINIIGTKGEKLKELPGAATQIEARELALLNPVGTQDALEYVPGVNGFSDDGMGNSRISVGIRGLPPRRSRRVLVMEDGIPIQPAIYAYSNMYYNPPAERIKEIEVIKGSGAIRFGPLTMGGVINYITGRPREEFGGTVTVTAGTNNYYSLFTEIGGWKDKLLKPEIQLLYKRADGYRENNDFDQYNGTIKFRYNPKNSKRNFYFKLNGNYENNNATYTGLTEYSFATNPRFNPKKYDNFKLYRFGFDAIHANQVNEKYRTDDKLYANYFDRRWWREFDVFVTAEDYESGIINPVDFLTNGDLVRVGNGDANMGILRTFYVAGYEKTFNLRHRLFQLPARLNAGGRLHYEHFDNVIQRGNSPDARQGVLIYKDPITGDTVFNGTSEAFQTYALSLFVEDELKIGKLSVTPGLRIENYYQTYVDHLKNDTSTSAFTYIFLPGFGFNLDLDKVNVFGGIHRGFTPAGRSSTLIIDYSNDKENVVLDPELSWNTELGLRGNTKYLEWEVAGYYLFIKNMVELGRGTTVDNLSSILSRGVENSLILKASSWKNWLPDAHITYTFLNTKIAEGEVQESALVNGPADISGNELPYAPNHTLILALVKHFNFGLDVRADMKYVSKSYADVENIDFTYNRGDTGPIPAYWVYNASIAYTWHKWRFALMGKNLADQIYIGSRLHSSPTSPTASVSSGILPGPRRQVNLSVTYSF